jgi:hypothetical protein
MHRRSEIDWARSKMTPKAVPAAPFGLVARQCHAEAGVDAATAIVAPTNVATKIRVMIALPAFPAKSRMKRRCARWQTSTKPLTESPTSPLGLTRINTITMMGYAESAHQRIAA